jgi:hypothetical protein
MPATGALASHESLAATRSVRGRKIADMAATVVLWVMASSIIVMLAAFIGYMIYLGGSAISIPFLFGTPKETTAGGGIGPEIYNSFYILILTLAFTVPIATCGRCLSAGVRAAGSVPHASCSSAPNRWPPSLRSSWASSACWSSSISSNGGSRRSAAR